MINLRDGQLQALRDYTVDLYRREGKAISNDDLNRTINSALPEIKKGTSLYSGFISPYKLEVQDKNMDYNEYVANYALAQIDMDLLTTHLDYMNTIEDYAFVYKEVVSSWSQITLKKARAVLAKVLLNTSEVVIGFIEKFITMKYIEETDFIINTDEGNAYSHIVKKSGTSINAFSIWNDRSLYIDLYTDYNNIRNGVTVPIDYVSQSNKLNLFIDISFESDVSIYISSYEPFYYELDGNGELILTASGRYTLEGLTGTRSTIRLYPLPDKVDTQYRYFSSFTIGMIDIDTTSKTLLSKAIDMEYLYSFYKIDMEPFPSDLDDLTVEAYLLTGSELDSGVDTTELNELKWINVTLKAITEAITKLNYDVDINDDNHISVKGEQHTTSVQFYSYDVFTDGITPESKLDIEEVIIGVDTFSKELADDLITYEGNIAGPYPSSLHSSGTPSTLELPVKITTYFTVSADSPNYKLNIDDTPFVIRSQVVHLVYSDKEIPYGAGSTGELEYQLNDEGAYYSVTLYNASEVSMVKTTFITYLSDILEAYDIENVHNLEIIDGEDNYIYRASVDLQDIGFDLNSGKFFIKSDEDYSTTTEYTFNYKLDFSRKTPYYIYRLYADMVTANQWQITPLSANIIANGGYIEFNDTVISTANTVDVSEGDNYLEIYASEEYDLSGLGINYDNNDLVYGYGKAIYLNYAEFMKSVGINDMTYYSVKYNAATPVLVLPFHYKKNLDRIDRVDHNTVDKSNTDSIKIHMRYKIDDGSATEYRGLAYRIKYSGSDQLIMDKIKIAVA